VTCNFHLPDRASYVGARPLNFVVRLALTEDHAMIGDTTLSCRAEVRPYPHGRAVVVDVFDPSAAHIASLLIRCSPRCAHFGTIAPALDDDLERLALDDFLAGRLSIDLGRTIESSQALRAAGRVDYPGQIIVELHHSPA
jgi:hypothetical protein